MGIMRALRPGTALGTATGTVVGALTDRDMVPVAVDPLLWEEALERSETLYASVPAKLWDETLTGPTVMRGYTDPDEEVRRLTEGDDWTVIDAEVSLYHRDNTLEHETWAKVSNDMWDTPVTDHVMYAGDLEYGIQRDEINTYLSDPDGQDIARDEAYSLVRETDAVEVEDTVVQHDESVPVTQSRTRELSGEHAATYIEQCFNNEAPYEQRREPTAVLYGDTGSYRIAVRAGNGQSVYRPAVSE